MQISSVKVVMKVQAVNTGL